MKLFRMFLAVLSMFAVLIVTLPASAEVCGTTVWDLTAGQTNKVGTVTVSNDQTNLYVTYTLNDPLATFGNLHLWVGNDLLNLPKTGTGNPIPGQFPFSHDATGLNTYTFTIPFSSINISDITGSCGNALYIVAHAEVGSETAFGGPTPGNTGNRWWFSGAYTLCCPGPIDPVSCLTQTAYAKGGWVWTTDKKSNPENLPSLNLTKNRWGWAINLTSPGTTTYDIFAGAGLNKTSNGAKVGTLTVTWDGTMATVLYSMLPGNYLEEVHIYAGDNSPTTIAPGQYGYPTTGYDVNDLTSFSYQVPLFDANGGGVWIVAHSLVSSGVCENADQ